MERTDRSLLIAFDGIDGAGKTTQVALLEGFLASKGKAIRTKEPTDGKWGQIIRRAAANGRLPLEEELLVLIEDRKEHVRDLILPALCEGKAVILDRYLYSTIAYQGSRGGSTNEISSLMFSLFPIPDLAIILDIPPEVGLARIKEGRGDVPNSFEDLETLTQVRRVFRNMVAKFENVVMIDGEKSIELIQQQIKKLVEQLALNRHWICA